MARRHGFSGWYAPPGAQRYHFFWDKSTFIRSKRSFCRYWYVDHGFMAGTPGVAIQCKDCQIRLANAVSRGLIPPEVLA